MAGQSRTLDAGYVKGKIAFAEPKAAVSALGAQQVKITGACVRITGTQLADTVKDFARERIPNDGREYEVTVDPISREVVAPAGEDISVEPELLSDSLHAGLNPVRINVKCPDLMRGGDVCLRASDSDGDRAGCNRPDRQIRRAFHRQHNMG